MKLTSTFSGQVALTLGTITGVALYPMAVYAPGEVIRASVAGALMATFNVLAGYASIRASMDKSLGKFLGYVLGGMVVRIMLLTGVLVLMVYYFDFQAVPLVGSLGVFYIAFLAIELVFIQKHLTTRRSN